MSKDFLLTVSLVLNVAPVAIAAAVWDSRTDCTVDYEALSHMTSRGEGVLAQRNACERIIRIMQVGNQGN